LRFAEALGSLGEKGMQTLYGYCDYAKTFSALFFSMAKKKGKKRSYFMLAS